jgi:hypothetical protein
VAAGFSTLAEMWGSDDSTQMVIVYRSAKKREFKIFTRENTQKKIMGDGVKKELIRWKDW